MTSPGTSPRRLLAGTSAVAGSGRAGGDRLHHHLDFHGLLPLPGRREHAGVSALFDDLERSGLTGRGGAGFPTALKVAAVAAAGRSRFGRSRPIVAVNVMEGEPASAKDRALATGAPHLLLDGAQVLAALVDASEIRICVADEHVDAAASLEAAADERAAAQLDPIAVFVDRVPAGYVAGEESALARWLDRGDGRPVFRPDRPAIPRADGRPVLVENAETTAHLALIARHGAGWFRQVGLPDAPGTTLLTLSGAVTRPGVWEVPLGTPLAMLLRDAGAGPGTGIELAGALLGGYGGTWLGAASLGVPLAPAPLAAAGATIGAGVVVALPATSCGLAETARIARWMAGESAGQCGPCVYGLAAMADDLAEVCGPSPQAAARALQRLQFRLGEVDGRGACRHPDGVVRLVRTALSAFADDLDRHVRSGPCRGVRSASVLPFPRGAGAAWSGPGPRSSGTGRRLAVR